MTDDEITAAIHAIIYGAVAELVDPGVLTPTKIGEAVEKALFAAGYPIVTAEQAEKIELYDDSVSAAEDHRWD